MTDLPRKQIVQARITQIGHSRYSEPIWILEGVGPASFRSHFISLDSGLVLEFSTAEITLATDPKIEMPGDTEGIPVDDLIGRTVTGLVRDDVFSSLIILEHHIFLRDANDGMTGNPLSAGYLEEYDPRELAQFVDYWTEQPVNA